MARWLYCRARAHAACLDWASALSDLDEALLVQANHVDALVLKSEV